MSNLDKITFKHEHLESEFFDEETFPKSTITIEFEADDLSVDDMFQKWKEFMSAMGYHMFDFELRKRGEE